MLFFPHFTFGFHGFHIKEIKIIQFDFGTGARKKICRCLGTVGLIVAPWKIDVLKTSIFALEVSLLWQILFLLSSSNFRGATISL